MSKKRIEENKQRASYVSLEDGLTAIVQRLVERVIKEAPPDRASKLVTEAFLLTGLRLPRQLARRIYQGVRAMQESDTYLAILEEGEAKGQAKAMRESILVFGEERVGSPDESIKGRLSSITDLPRLKRMVRRAAKAATWQEILDTP